MLIQIDTVNLAQQRNWSIFTRPFFLCERLSITKQLENYSSDVQQPGLTAEFCPWSRLENAVRLTHKQTPILVHN